MSFWDQFEDEEIDSVKGTEGGLYLKPGNFLLQVQRCKMIETRDGNDAFVAELKVIETDIEDKDLQPGAEPSLYVNLSGKFPKLALGNVNDFVRAGLGSLAQQHGEDHPPLEEITLNKDIMKKITGAKNLLAGVYLDCNAFNKPTREGRDFTRMKWKVPDNVAEIAQAYAA